MSRVAQNSSDDWSSAASAVDAYLKSLRIHDRALRERLGTRVLESAQARAIREPRALPSILALEELDRLTNEWVSAVLDEPPRHEEDALFSARGRLALLLAEMPEKWPEQFLQPGPWPPPFVQAMRAGFLRAGPDFQVSHMQPRPIDLGPIVPLTRLGNLPYFRMILAWLGFAALLVLIFRITHS